MLGVTFGNKHSYNDWGIWLEDTHINPPLPKRYIVDVPARNGLLDLTPELTPTIRFENRTLTFTFRVKAGDWSTLMSQIYGQIHGQTLDIVSDLDPNWHWHGCVTVDDFSSDERTGVLVITVDADPFKLSNTENSYTVNGNGTITCEVDRMEISPAFEIEAPTTVIYGDSSYTIESAQTTEKTLSGEIVSFADGTANPAVDLTADIDAVQDLNGYNNPWVGGAGKNKLAPWVTAQTLGNVTYTVNSDGSFKTSGTANANSQLVTPRFRLPAGSYILSGCPSGGSGSTYYLRIIEYSGTTSTVVGSASDYGSGATYTVTSDSNDIVVFSSVANGVASPSATWYPMLRKATDPAGYEPYENICPISGWDEVNVCVSEINVWDEEWESGDINIANGSKRANASRIRSKNFISVKPSTTYYSKNPYANPTICFYDASQGWVSSAVNVGYVGGGNVAFTTPSWCHYIMFYMNGTTYNNDISINYPSTDHDYHEYNGATYTTDLDGTRYGGTLDVTTGVLTITHGFKTLNGASTESWNEYSSYNGFSITFYDMAIGTRQDGLCNWLIKNPTGNDKGFWLGVNSRYFFVIRVADLLNEYSVSAWKTYLASNPLEIMYPLATPQTVQLSAEQVMILKNQNNIWADSGEVEVTYLAQDFAGKKFFIPDLELTEGSHTLTIQGTGTTKVTYTNGRL